MVDDYEHLYNRVLDVTACIHIPVKLFSMTIVALSTTTDQFHYSVLILNVMFWLIFFLHLSISIQLGLPNAFDLMDP
ncbi:hypothetical protein L596_022253 [Steinernema carpocapsae]|uniref:Uncharacterized protein n=1 Tax=Steinernema carpocapsae TaxID=34508 RepID=A0A4U5MLA0_STECR|nr:hypothetical protein L596_022253 [Steinernema carpocapsae]